MAITTVIFDLGGVLVSTHWDRLTGPVSELTGLTPERVMEDIRRGDPYNRFMRGEIGPHDFWRQFNRQFGLGLSEDELKALWTGIIVNKPDVDHIVRALAGRFRLSLGSNTDPLHYARGREVQPVQDLLDEAVLSFEIGVCKPDPAFFQRALEVLSAQAGETVLIDDVTENVEAARTLGLAGIVYGSPGQLEADLSALGLL